jgi:hypothetical protein
MRLRQTLNGLQARTMRDAVRDPYDTISGPARGSKATTLERVADCLLGISIGIAIAFGLAAALGGA